MVRTTPILFASASFAALTCTCGYIWIGSSLKKVLDNLTFFFWKGKLAYNKDRTILPVNVSEGQREAYLVLFPVFLSTV